MNKPIDIEKAQRKAKWKRRFYVAIVTALVVTNIYVVVDTVITSHKTRELDQQMSEVNRQWSHVIDQIQKRLSSQE